MNAGRNRRVYRVEGGVVIDAKRFDANFARVFAAPAEPKHIEPPKPKKKRKPQPSGLGIEGLLAKIARLDERRIAMPHGPTRTNLAKKIRLTRRKLREDQARTLQAARPLNGEW